MSLAGGHHGGHGFRYTGVFLGAGYALWRRAYYWPDYNPGVRAPVLPSAPFPGN